MIDEWIKRWSEITEYDLCPLWLYWSYPVYDTTMCNELKRFQPFLPDDKVTQDRCVQ